MIGSFIVLEDDIFYFTTDANLGKLSEKLTKGSVILVLDEQCYDNGFSNEWIILSRAGVVWIAKMSI